MRALSLDANRVIVDDAAGGRIVSLQVDGRELLVAAARDASPTSYGCFPMAPWAGRIRDGRLTWEGETHELPINHPPHAIHGTVFDRPWTVDATDGVSLRMSVDLGPRWPWPGRAVQHLTLGSTRLDLRLEVHATAEPFPAWCGWHPWFRRPVELSFSAGEMFVRDEGGIPTGERVAPPPGPWDDCFTEVRAAPVLRWPDGPEIAVGTSAAYLVVFTEPEHAVCVEPQTAPPDAAALGLATVVTPDRPLVAEAAFAWGAPIL